MLGITKAVYQETGFFKLKIFKKTKRMKNFGVNVCILFLVVVTLYIY